MVRLANLGSLHELDASFTFFCFWKQSTQWPGKESLVGTVFVTVMSIGASYSSLALSINSSLPMQISNREIARKQLGFVLGLDIDTFLTMCLCPNWNSKHVLPHESDAQGGVPH